jgi:hypothetical protein
VRLGVLHLGSDTVHLLGVDGHRGGHSAPDPGGGEELLADARSDLRDATGSAVVPARVREPHRLAAGAPDAETAMLALRVPQVEIHPSALREGVILRTPDTLDGTAQIDRSAQDAPQQLGRLTTFEARCTG